MAKRTIGLRDFWKRLDLLEKLLVALVAVVVVLWPLAIVVSKYQSPTVPVLDSESAGSSNQLTTDQRRELTVFGLRALGVAAGLSDVKNVLTVSELRTTIAAGLNMNELLCAEVREILPLRLKGKYEVTCVAYRGGSSLKTYVLDALNGVAFEQ